MNGYCVYKHTAPNGKVYIGITCQNPLYRWNNGNGYARSPHMRNAIAAYGWDNIQHEILFAGLSAESAEEKEKELIALYDSTNPKRGYNIDSGGKAGRPLTDETKQKISLKKKGMPSNRLGSTQSVESRQKMSNTKKLIYQDEHKRKELTERAVKRKIVNLTTGEAFHSISAASREYGVSVASLWGACNGKCKTVMGSKWSYVSE